LAGFWVRRLKRRRFCRLEDEADGLKPVLQSSKNLRRALAMLGFQDKKRHARDARSSEIGYHDEYQIRRSAEIKKSKCFLARDKEDIHCYRNDMKGDPNCQFNHRKGDPVDEERRGRVQ
jgi:hypothetical protein